MSPAVAMQVHGALARKAREARYTYCVVTNAIHMLHARVRARMSS